MTLERQSPRRVADRILSVEMGPNNHAIVLNISNDGLGFHALNPLTQSGTIHFSFLDGAQRVEASGELVWIDSAKQTGGLRFASLPQSSRERLHNWAAATSPNAAATENAQPNPPPLPSNPPVQEAQVTAPPAPSVPAPNVAAARAFTPVEETSQNVGDFWYQAPEYAEYQEDRAAFSRSRGKFFWGFLSGAIVAVILAAGLLAAGDNPMSHLLAEAKTTIFGAAPAPPPPQGTSTPTTQAAAPQGAIPPPLVSSGLPAAAASVAPSPSLPLPESTSGFNPGDVAAQTAPKLPTTANKVEEGNLKNARENLARQSDNSDDSGDSGDEDLALAQKYLKAKTGPATNTAAVQLLWAAVGKGNVTAEFTLADLYARGEGVAKSCDQARVLVNAAQGKSNTDASQELAELIRKCR